MSTADVSAETAGTEVFPSTALTAENRTVEIDSATLVYRRSGEIETDAPPLVMLKHLRGNLENWDPALVDRLATDREVILLDNRAWARRRLSSPATLTTWRATLCASSTRWG